MVISVVFFVHVCCDVEALFYVLLSFAEAFVSLSQISLCSVRRLLFLFTLANADLFIPADLGFRLTFGIVSHFGSSRPNALSYLGDLRVCVIDFR